MTDFDVTPPLFDWTEVKATTNLTQTAFTTAAIPTGSGAPPYENYATGVQFLVEPTLNDAIGNLVFTVQASNDNATWFTLNLPAFTGTIAASNQVLRFAVPVNSRQFRYVRGSLAVSTAPGATPSTARVLAKTIGLYQPWTKSGAGA